MIEVKLPIWGETPKDIIEEVVKLTQSTSELGFLHAAYIHDEIKQNKDRGTFWYALLDGQIAGISSIGSRRAYSHLARHGSIAVRPEFRRKRVGTALYTAQVFQCLLEGRREIEDTIIVSLSPWMCGKTICGPGFLPVLGYNLYGTLPARTGAFRDIELWGKATLEVLDWETRCPEGTTFEIIDTDTTQKTFLKNMAVYLKNSAQMVPQFMAARKSFYEGDGVVMTVDRRSSVADFSDLENLVQDPDFQQAAATSDSPKIP